MCTYAHVFTRVRVCVCASEKINDYYFIQFF